MKSVLDRHLRVPYYCEVQTRPQTHRALIWRYGGSIRGSHQPFMCIDIIEHPSEVAVRICVEATYPGIDYAPYPQVINGKVYP